MVDASRIMPNIYYLGYKTGEAWFWLSNSVTITECPLKWFGPLLDHGNSTTASGSTSSSPDWGIVDILLSGPRQYSDWWWKLVQQDPIHVAVETLLVVSILYILMSRSKDYKTELRREKLTPAEEEELLKEWKLHGRAPLTPKAGGPSKNAGRQHRIVVHKVHGPYLDVTTELDESSSSNNNTPTSMALTKGTTKPLQQQQQSQLQSVLNFATFDFLGLSQSSLVKEAADQALNKYGCGSCGPRGFYGTIDVHLQLEQAYSQFLGTEDAILYSDGASTVSSTIAAFCKRGDLIVCDDAVYEPIRTGVALSRAHVKWFPHNDMQELRRVLERVQQSDAKVGRAVNLQRRFLIVEGLYKQTGQICPLDQLVQLKHEFHYRLIVDESLSFGTLGATGRGITEYYPNLKLMRDVEITTIALEHAMGSVGGITTGTDEVVDHQRLSGSGYCFSASSPPFTAVAATAALQALKPAVLQKLADNRSYLHHKLSQLCHDRLEDVMIITSHEASPLVLLQVADLPETKDLEEVLFLKEVTHECLLRNLGLVVVTEHAPGIRWTVTAEHTHELIDQALQIFAQAVDVVLSKFQESG